MRRRLFYLFLAILLSYPTYGQGVIIPIIVAATMPEHGFLPGKKFPIYPTIGKFNFSDRKLRVELYDDREAMKLKHVACSEVEFTNTSEFSALGCVYKVSQYLDSLFHRAHAKLDTTSTDTLTIRLEGIDARLIGFGYIRVHGLCQMRFNYRNFEQTYCADIVDGDKHSPLGSKALVTRKTATRYLASAAIREVIEQFFVDFEKIKYLAGLLPHTS